MFIYKAKASCLYAQRTLGSKQLYNLKHNVLNLRQKYTVLDDFSVAKHDPGARILRLLARVLYQYKHIGMFLHENAFRNSRV